MIDTILTSSMKNDISISGNTPSTPKWGEFNKQDGIAATQTDRVNLGLLVGIAAQEVSPGIIHSNVVTIDLDDYRFSAGTIPVPFVGHGLVPNPAMPAVASLFEKRGKGACELNLKTGEMLRSIETAENRKFYGHGTYSSDGSLLFATETITEDKFDGVIVVRDADTMKVLGEFPSYGPRPHDCILIEDGKTMVITNGGGFVGEEPGSVTFVDVDSQKLLEKLEIDNHSINAGHVAITADRDLAVVSAPREGMSFADNCGGISIGSKKYPFQTIKEPEILVSTMFGETLSVCIDDKNRVAAVTTPDANLVSFWSLDSGKLLHQMSLPMPKGIALTQKRQYYMISYGREDLAVGLVNVDDFKPAAGYDIYAPVSGSHIFSYTFSTVSGKTN